ncbi:MAG: hypothetical protein Q8903_12715 [Bacteroidota bacterium]|nr:hypothetical protein [Bacteroidota bacterium]
MLILWFVFILNSVIGLLIPFRQYRNGFFLYFLVTGIADPINMYLRSIFHYDLNIGALIYYILALIITTYYVKKKESSKYYILFYSVLFLLVLLYSFNILFQSKTPLGRQIVLGSSFIILLLVLYNLFTIMFRNIFETGKVNLYFVLLCLCNILPALRIGLLALRLESFAVFHNIAYFVEAIISIFFLFYNIKTSPKFSLAGSKAISEEAEE